MKWRWFLESGDYTPASVSTARQGMTIHSGLSISSTACFPKNVIIIDMNIAKIKREKFCVITPKIIPITINKQPEAEYGRKVFWLPLYDLEVSLPQ